MRRSPNAGLMLAHSLRRWANINPALGERLVLAGYALEIALSHGVDCNAMIMAMGQAQQQLKRDAALKLGRRRRC